MQTSSGFQRLAPVQSEAQPKHCTAEVQGSDPAPPAASTILLPASIQLPSHLPASHHAPRNRVTQAEGTWRFRTVTRCTALSFSPIPQPPGTQSSSTPPWQAEALSRLQHCLRAQGWSPCTHGRAARLLVSCDRTHSFKQGDAGQHGKCHA